MTSYGLMSLADHLPDPVTGEQLTQAERYELIVTSAIQAEAAGFALLGSASTTSATTSCPTR